MEEYKSMDYLKDIKNDNILTNDDLISILENIGYILADNGYMDARIFLDEIMDAIEEKEISID